MPFELRLLRGNPSKRAMTPSLRVLPPPEPPPPPDFLSPYAVEEWERIAGELHSLRVLTPLDHAVFGAYCEAYSLWRTAGEALAKEAEDDPISHGLIVEGKDGGKVNLLVSIASSAARDMLRFAGEFGMTPAARSRIISGVDPHDPRGKFGDLLA
jgi:P27 family predicted phage terminase small subunit